MLSSDNRKNGLSGHASIFERQNSRPSERQLQEFLRDGQFPHICWRNDGNEKLEVIANYAMDRSKIDNSWQEPYTNGCTLGSARERVDDGAVVS